MFKIGDCVLNQKTGDSGKVIGYGHEIVGGVFQSTLKVRVTKVTTLNHKGFVEEDLSSAWMRVEE